MSTYATVLDSPTRQPYHDLSKPSRSHCLAQLHKMQFCSCASNKTGAYPKKRAGGDVYIIIEIIATFFLAVLSIFLVYNFFIV